MLCTYYLLDFLKFEMDVFDKKKRSWIMSRIKGKDTRPEIIIRSLVHRLGYRFRKYVSDLPGHPDIVLPKHRKVIFVHGCFWHGHKQCGRSSRPSTNSSFWNEKLDANIIRDRKNIRLLKKQNWEVLVVWQCQLKDLSKLTPKLSRFLQSKKGPSNE